MTRTRLSIGLLCAALASGCSGNSNDKPTGAATGDNAKPAPDPATPVVEAPRVPDVQPAALPADPGARKLASVWARGFGGEETDAARAVAIDAAGSVAVGGYFRGTVDFGDGAQREAGEADAFVTLTAPDGAHRWTVSFGGVNGDKVHDDVVNAVAFAPDGGLVIAGQFAYAAQVGDYVMTSAGSDDAFAIKLTGDGKVAWAFRLGGMDSDGANGVAVDAVGNTFVTGSFQRSIEVAGQKLESEGRQDVFLVKLTPAGEPVWIRRYGALYDDVGQRVAVDSRGNPILFARFHDEVAFGGDPLEPEGNQDLALVKLDADGEHQWSQRFGSPFNELGLGLAVDPADNIAIAGSFDNEIQFGAQRLASAGESDVFVARLNPAGGLLWAIRFGGGREDIGAGIATDKYGNLFVTGWFRGKVDFGGGPLASAEDNKDVFVVELSPEGKHRWSRRYGDRDHDQGRGLAANGDGRVAVIGLYRFRLGLGSKPLESARNPDDKAPPPDGFVGVFAP